MSKKNVEVIKVEAIEDVVPVVEMPPITEKIKDVKSDESPRFTLAQLVESARYKKYGYLLESHLKQDGTYALDEVDELLSGLITR